MLVILVDNSAGDQNGFGRFTAVTDPGDALVRATIAEIVDVNEARIQIDWGDVPTTRGSDREWLVSSHRASPVYLRPQEVYMS